MLAQRLVPRLCQECKKADKLPEKIQEIIKKEIEKLPKETITQLPNYPITNYQVYHSPGCPACKNKGVSGRIALFEILEMTPELEEIINTSPTEHRILEEARHQGMISLRQDGILKALEGLVSIEEVLRETMEM
jgi:type IV pilus assembly protein PilB